MAVSLFKEQTGEETQITPTAHAKRSPSGAHGWTRCSEWESDPTGSYSADEGTVAHEVAAMSLESGNDPHAYIGRVIRIQESGREIEVTKEMADYVQEYVTFCRCLGGVHMVESSFEIGHITGEPGGKGTSDFVSVDEPKLTVVDLKYGANPHNTVEAKNNEQGILYMLGALDEVSLLYAVEEVTFIICQPRCNHFSEWKLTVEELEQFREQMVPASSVNPGAKQCKWCAKSGNCEAETNRVLTIVSDDFIDMTSDDEESLTAKVTSGTEKIPNHPDHHLGSCMAVVGLVENWCKAIRARTERQLLDGQEVPGFKLVQGRRGPRKWNDEKEAEETLKAMRVKQDDMYDRKLISPTTAEKLHKDGTIGQRQWPKLQTLITQSDGSPSVAPISDKRPAIEITPVEDDFEALV